MKREIKTIFIAEDGKQFDVENDCLQYEEELKKKKVNTTYWKVYSKPDTTEGRGHYQLEMLEVYNPEAFPKTKIWVEDYCYRKYGRPIAFIMGVSPMLNWYIVEIDVNEFNTKAHTRVGDYSYDAIRRSLTISKNEEGLV